MNHALRGTAALLAAAAIAVLAGCTGAPSTTSAVVSTAAPASVQRFACPTRAEVAGLTAVPFGESTSSGASCTYTTASDASTVATVTLRHPDGAADATLAALRYAAIGRGATTADARGIAFDAFTSTTKRDCTVSFTAADGAASAVTARRAGSGGAGSCAVATAVATLAGGASPKAPAPTVAVLAPRTLLGTTTSAQRWPWRIGRDAAVRVDRLTGTGYLDPASTGSFAKLASTVPADAAAVVFVSGTAEAGTPSLTVLRRATRALSAASGRAPKAELIVVGPISDGTVPFEQLAALRTDLQSVAKIAGARYVDPSTLAGGDGSAAAVLAGVADGAAAALRSAGVAG
jgi:hypothetical protein